MKNKLNFILNKEYWRFDNLLIFMICILLYLFNIFIFSEINNEFTYFFNCYFNDLIAPLLLFSYTNFIMSFLKLKIYSLKYLLIMILISSFVWEFAIKYIKPNSVTDPIDLIFYLLGTIVYWSIFKYLLLSYKIKPTK